MARMSATIAATLAKSIPLEPPVARGTVTGGAFSSSSGWCSSGPSLRGEAQRRGQEPERRGQEPRHAAQTGCAQTGYVGNTDRLASFYMPLGLADRVRGPPLGNHPCANPTRAAAYLRQRRCVANTATYSPLRAVLRAHPLIKHAGRASRLPARHDTRPARWHAGACVRVSYCAAHHAGSAAADHRHSHRLR